MSRPSQSGRDFELEEMVKVLEGTFDNYEQCYWEEIEQIAPELRHRRMTSVYRRVDLPAFKGTVFYAHKWWDGDTENFAYRNLYVVNRDPTLNALRLDLLTIPNPERFENALEDESLLRILSPSEMITMPAECNTVWRKQGDAFHVTMAGQCMLTSVSPTDEALAIEVDTRIDQENFLYLSIGRDEHGNILYGPKDLVHSRELRARWFDCSATLAGVTSHFRIHDQGGFHEIGGPSPIRIRLRQVKWPSHEREPMLALIAMREGQQEILIGASQSVQPVIATAAPKAKSIGLISGDLSVTCKVAQSNYGACA